MLNMPKLNKFYVPEIRIHPGNIHQNTLRMWKNFFSVYRKAPELEVVTFIPQIGYSDLFALAFGSKDPSNFENILIENEGITFIFTKQVYNDLIMLLPNSDSYFKFSNGPNKNAVYLQIINPRIM
ncbi:hypothetical protein FDH01_gp244 [Acinetobacter phage vB_AbaM_ME3]|uniref:Uncharacterized protein n=1 Tax=Acinetobacter phage vB_AbaM_ME3 TaxID=1837876 RepID=A0A172Q0I5_9CAUD|nr:hypothetical protein FDH01_gp244 [Acinetobacter phage vB_AbaM_ME3]AND75378.1 hypothetical protein ME3_217 [Acinetobacter phage vB_AbaM_ME3]